MTNVPNTLASIPTPDNATSTDRWWHDDRIPNTRYFTTHEVTVPATRVPITFKLFGIQMVNQSPNGISVEAHRAPFAYVGVGDEATSLDEMELRALAAVATEFADRLAQ